MSMLYACGQYLSLLERALSITMTPSADALFPAVNLADARPSRVGKHGSNAANPEVRWDGALMTPSGAGTYTVTVRAGERLRLVSSGSTSITAQNQQTKKYVTNAGAWQTASSSITVTSLDFQIESLTLCQSPTVTLKIVVTTGTSVTLWPRWNAAMVYGHNLDPGLTVELRSSIDNFSASNVLEVTGAILQPSFYMLQSSGISNRYGRVLLTGTNSQTPWYGEVVPTWLETAVAGHVSDGYEVKYQESQIRSDGRFGTVSVSNLTALPRRVAKFTFRPQTLGAAELRQEINWRSRGGAYPLLMVPNSTEAVVLYGRLSDSWQEKRMFMTMWETDLLLAEEPIAAPLA